MISFIKKTKYILHNENGSIIVVALMLLALLTVLGLSAINTSTTERHLAVNTLLYERAFYASEAGFEHAKGLLRIPFIAQNQANMALGNQASWSFVLNGSGVIPGLSAAVDTDFEGGVTLVQSNLDGVLYTVTVWNNNDGGGATNDTDGRIMVRTEATGPRGATCAIESLIAGTTSSGSIDGYKAQAGAGAGKSYSNNDMEAMDVFDKQI